MCTHYLGVFPTIDNTFKYFASLIYEDAILENFPFPRAITFNDIFGFYLPHCLPFALLSKILEKGGPYPQVILPQFGGYWIEDVEAPAGTPSSSESSFCEEEDGGEGMSPGGGHSYRLECNSTARAYRKHFLGNVSVCVLTSVCI